MPAACSVIRRKLSGLRKMSGTVIKLWKRFKAESLPPLCERIDGCKSEVQSAGQTVSFNVGINNQISKNEENLNFFFSHAPYKCLKAFSRLWKNNKLEDILEWLVTVWQLETGQVRNGSVIIVGTSDRAFACQNAAGQNAGWRGLREELIYTRLQTVRFAREFSVNEFGRLINVLIELETTMEIIILGRLSEFINLKWKVKWKTSPKESRRWSSSAFSVTVPKERDMPVTWDAKEYPDMRLRKINRIYNPSPVPFYSNLQILYSLLGTSTFKRRQPRCC